MLNRDGESVVHQNMTASPGLRLKVMAPSRTVLVMAVDCRFTWYWVATLCAQEGIPLVLGHTLSLQAIPGGQTTHDRIEAHTMPVRLPVSSSNSLPITTIIYRASSAIFGSQP